MSKIIKALLIVFALAASSAEAVVREISGPTADTWETGDTVIVRGPSYVPNGKSLLIEPGVLVIIKCDDPFNVYGGFRALGDSLQPIYLVPTEGWDGFHFIYEPGQSDTCWMRYVIVPDAAPTPLRLVVGENADMAISRCVLRAQRSCVMLFGGHVWADFNRLTTTAIYSSTVVLNGLGHTSASPCGNVHNFLRDNLIVADVEEGSWRPFSQTYGLKLLGTSDICLMGNDVSVSTPWEAIGVFADTRDAQEPTLTVLQYSVVTVRSRGGNQTGVMYSDGVGGWMDVLRCTIDIASADTSEPRPSSYSFGIKAMVSGNVEVNSSAIELDDGNYHIFGDTRGVFLVDYNCIWSQSWSTSFDGGNTIGPWECPLDSVILGDSNRVADPRFAREGVWGEWPSFDAVRIYYSPEFDSPCINAGDPLNEPDPDGSRPDVGRYYYSATAVDPTEVVVLVPDRFRMLPAYPNPFNSTVVVPFEIGRSSHVKIRILDILGREVEVIAEGVYGPGRYGITYDAGRASSGVYLVAFELNGKPPAAQRLLLIR